MMRFVFYFAFLCYGFVVMILLGIQTGKNRPTTKKLTPLLVWYGQSVPQTRLRFEKKMIGIDPEESADEWEDEVDDDDGGSGSGSGSGSGGDGWASSSSGGSVRAGGSGGGGAGLGKGVDRERGEGEGGRKRKQ